MKPSAKTILEALQRGEQLSTNDSCIRYGIRALGQRITELRKAGYPIKDRYGKVNGKRAPFKIYFMDTVKPSPRTETVVRAHVRRMVAGVEEMDEQPGLFA